MFCFKESNDKLYTHFEEFNVSKNNEMLCYITFPYGWVIMAYQLSLDRKLLSPGEGRV